MRFKNNVINSALILYSEAVFRDYMKPGFDFNMLIYKTQLIWWQFQVYSKVKMCHFLSKLRPNSHRGGELFKLLDKFT